MDAFDATARTAWRFGFSHMDTTQREPCGSGASDRRQIQAGRTALTLASCALCVTFFMASDLQRLSENSALSSTTPLPIEVEETDFLSPPESDECADVYAASWWQSVSRFLELDFSDIGNLAKAILLLQYTLLVRE